MKGIASQLVVGYERLNRKELPRRNSIAIGNHARNLTRVIIGKNGLSQPLTFTGCNEVFLFNY